MSESTDIPSKNEAQSWVVSIFIETYAFISYQKNNSNTKLLLKVCSVAKRANNFTNWLRVYS